MATRVRIVCGPAGAGKTARLWGRWLAEARSKPGAALWLTPTRRRAEALRARMLGETGGILGARFSTFAEVADTVVLAHDPDARPLGEVQRRLLLDDFLEALRPTGRLGHFERVAETRGFAEGLTALLQELRSAGVAAGDFAAAVRTGAGSKLRHCAALIAAYEQELQRRNAVDADGHIRRAADLIRRGFRRPFASVRCLFADDFNDFTPVQLDLLEALAGGVDEFWLALPDEPGDERAEPFARPRETRGRLERWSPEIEWARADHGESPVVDPSSVPPSTLSASESGYLPFGRGAGQIPVGLLHLREQLFRPPRRVEPGADADGISLIEAPGVLGEVRLVARRVKELLLAGVAPDDVVVTARDLGPYADLLGEVFDEYGIPADVEGEEPLARNPAVSVLLRALRLPDDDWPFAAVTALLRNTYFRPAWAEAAEPPDVPQRAEALLRLLGEARGRDSFLAAAARWAREQQPGLEDEDAEESRRRRTHELAKECGPFLGRFFHAWDDAPGSAPAAEHVDWLERIATELGIRTAADTPRDRHALEALFGAARQWAESPGAGGSSVDRRTFHRRLATLATAAGLPRSERGQGRVRVLAASSCRHLETDHVFLLGLGERGFPRLTPLASLLDDDDRQILLRAGLELPSATDPMPGEMLLYYQVVTRARRGLTLSYPAVDDRGQPLLPSSFLNATLACFRTGAVTVERRRMLLDGIDRDRPLSPAEFRVRLAASGRGGLAVGRGLSVDLRDNLADAADLVRLRFREREHNPYDGLFRDARVIGEVGRLFGPDRVFSPTALEDYVACPFRFFLRHALRLAPLEEPREEVEVTRRGQAFHRALARLHRKLRENGVHAPEESVGTHAREEIAFAVDEDVQRAPSPASKALWRLEGERLVRAASKYLGHWEKFLAPWGERGVAPQPNLFEVDFGLPSVAGTEPVGPLVLRVGGAEVRVSGRIDRVDVAELPGGGVGFWVIDYKTGRTANYTGADLSGFRKLQLTLYAMAVEEVLLADRGARPLGLAYWMVAEQGPKVALPTRNQVLWLDETKRWRAVREQLCDWVATLVTRVRGGLFPLQPRSEECTATCDYGQVCRIAQARPVGKPGLLPLPEERSRMMGDE